MQWRAIPFVPRRLKARAVGRDPAALSIYRPFRLHARAVRPLRDRMLGRALLPGAAPPVPQAEPVLAALHDGSATLAAIASNHSERWIVGVAEGGELHQVVKVNGVRDPGITNERAVLEELDGGGRGWRAPLPSDPPRDAPVDIVVQEAVGVAASPVRDLDDAADMATKLVRAGWRHGDLTPWNLSRAEDGTYVLVDWEWARPAAEPLADLLHFAAVATEWLGALTAEDVARALHDERSVFGRHLHEVGADPADAPALAMAIAPTIPGVDRFPIDLQRLLAGSVRAPQAQRA